MNRQTMRGRSFGAQVASVGGHWRRAVAAVLAIGIGAAPACDRQPPTGAEQATAAAATVDHAVTESGLPGAAYDYDGTVHTVAGAGDIEPALTALRALLGEPLNTTPGPHPGGRREINWDGVPPALTNTNDFPGDFFNSTDPAAPNGRKRGAVFTTRGTGFRISDNDFSDLEASYADQFRFFSPIRTFAQLGSRSMDVTFRLPGTDVPAVVNGFAVVLSDVDRLSSGLIFYDRDGRQLAVAPAPPRKSGEGHTVIGMVFDAPVVARVVIVAGERAVAPGRLDVSSGGTHDLVVTDDFLYGEPQPID